MNPLRYFITVQSLGCLYHPIKSLQHRPFHVSPPPVHIHYLVLSLSPHHTQPSIPKYPYVWSALYFRLTLLYSVLPFLPTLLFLSPNFLEHSFHRQLCPFPPYPSPCLAYHSLFFIFPVLSCLVFSIFNLGLSIFFPFPIPYSLSFCTFLVFPLLPFLSLYLLSLPSPS